jgi:competence protein ComEC
LTSKPIQKKQSIQIAADIEAILQKGKSLSKPGKAILYFQEDSLTKQLQKGDILLVHAQLAPPEDDGNPDSFDYAKYLHRHGIGLSGFVRQGYWKAVGHNPRQSFSDIALAQREKILDIYCSQKWDKDVESIVSALTVGYKDELSSDIRETYSITGASHVLALSGLHIAFLYQLITFLLLPLGAMRGTKAIQCIIVIALLWAFAFFTGLAPSVIRAVIMCSLYTISKALTRNNFSINTLTVAAFFMLLFAPEWLFDVGFQLSFCAVASLLLFRPHVERIFMPRTKLGKKAWQLTCVSISAQLGTMPLIIYYFSRFSVYFIFSGFIVIPLAGFIMYATSFLLITIPFGAVHHIISLVIAQSVNFMNSSLRWIEKLPSASIDGIWMYSSEIILYYLILYMILGLIHTHRFKYMFASLVSVLILLGIHQLYKTNDAPKDCIAFYNVRSCPAVHCISSNKSSWIVCADKQCRTDNIQKRMRRHWNRLRLEKPQIIYLNHHAPELSVINNIISYKGKRIGIISDNRWRYQKAMRPLKTDYLYISRGYKGKIEELLTLFDTDKIILDSSLSKWRKERYKTTCDSIGIPNISLEKGCHKILI